MTEQVELRRLLVIAGSDSSGGAGIQGDIKTGTAMGVDVLTAITAVTAQNSLGVQAVEPVSLEMARAQIESICSDLPPHAVKLGMLYDAARVQIAIEAIRRYELHNVVCDPVLVSTSGTRLLDTEGMQALIAALPLFALVTPNAPEAAALTGRRVETATDLLSAGRKLLDLGARAVLLKGGHFRGNESTDMLLQNGVLEPIRFSAPRIETRNDHGTGCALATAIASGLALGVGLRDAVATGRAFVQAALQRSAGLRDRQGRGSMNLLITSSPPKG